MSMSTILEDKVQVHPRTYRDGLEREHRYNITVSLTLELCGGINTVTGLV